MNLPKPSLFSPSSPTQPCAAIKAIVFFTWWQGLGIAVLVQLGVIGGSDHHSAREVAEAAQNYIICFEMFLAAILHRRAFHVTDVHSVGLPPCQRCFPFIWVPCPHMPYSPDLLRP